MDRPPDDPDEDTAAALAPMPPGELRQEGALQVRDLLAPHPPPVLVGVDWHELFDVFDSRELVERLAEDDPLSLRSRVVRTCREHAFLLHADRLMLRALAMCAYKGQLYTGSPPLDAWCDGIVLRGARDLLREDVEREFDAETMLAEDLVCFRLFVELFGVEPSASRLASVRFHQAPRTARRIVWRAALEGHSLDEIADREQTTRQEAARHVRETLEAMASPRRPDWNDLASEEDAP